MNSHVTNGRSFNKKATTAATCPESSNSSQIKMRHDAENSVGRLGQCWRRSSTARNFARNFVNDWYATNENAQQHTCRHSYHSNTPACTLVIYRFNRQLHCTSRTLLRIRLKHPRKNILPIRRKSCQLFNKARRTLIPYACYDLEHYYAERIDIGARRCWITIAAFGGKSIRCAKSASLARTRQLQPSTHLRVHDTSNAKVRENCVSIVTQENILRLKIAMYNSMRMTICERVPYVTIYGCRLIPSGRDAFCKSCGQSIALDKIHSQPRPAVLCRAVIRNTHYVRMAKRREYACLR